MELLSCNSLRLEAFTEARRRALDWKAHTNTARMGAVRAVSWQTKPIFCVRFLELAARLKLAGKQLTTMNFWRAAVSVAVFPCFSEFTPDPALKDSQMVSKSTLPVHFARRLLVCNGTTSLQDPGTTADFLRKYPKGAYTTTRTAHGCRDVLFWDCHLARLADSIKRLIAAHPELYPRIPLNQEVSVSFIKALCKPSCEAVAHHLEAWEGLADDEEVAITILVCKRGRGKDATSEPSQAPIFDVYVHLSAMRMLPLGFAGLPQPATVAVMGPGRELPAAKFSLWVSRRQHLERCRPSGATEVILSNDGDELLEGLVTNLFVVASRNLDTHDDVAPPDWSGLEVQTAPLENGILAGTVRQQIIEACQVAGIPLRYVAPSWSQRHSWREAFVTSALRLVQPVIAVQMPARWHSGDAQDPWPTSQEWHPWYLPETSGGRTSAIRDLVVERAQKCSINISDLGK